MFLLCSIITLELLTALVAVLGNAILDEEGAIVLVVVDKVVSAYPTSTVWGFTANEGKEDMTGLVTFGVIEVVPVAKSEHVRGVLMTTANEV